jgi:hypothetical protein
VSVQEVLGEAGEPCGVDPEPADVVADAAAELLLERGLALRERTDPLAGRVVTVDARAPEVPEDPVEQPRRAGVEPGAVEGDEGVEDPAVLGGVDPEPVGLLLQPLGLVADLDVGVDVAQQRADRGDAA